MYMQIEKRLQVHKNAVHKNAYKFTKTLTSSQNQL